MTGSPREALSRALGAMRMKHMDPALLSFAIANLAVEMRVYSEQFKDAMMLAAYVHRDDRRGGRGDLANDVYITHPYRNVLLPVSPTGLEEIYKHLDTIQARLTATATS